MDKVTGIFIMVIVLLALFYINERTVKVVKENPNESNPELVGKGIAEAGKDVSKTIKAIGEGITDSQNITNTST